MHSWDVFIAHDSLDKMHAERLYDLLSQHCRVFLDSKCLQPGDNWDSEIPQAHSVSKISAILIPKKTGEAHYLRDEIAVAIAMAREDTHRVVPIFIHPSSKSSVNALYGLNRKHGIVARGKSGLEKSALKIRQLIEELKGIKNGVISAENNGQSLLATPRHADGIGADEIAATTEVAPIQLIINRSFEDYTESEKEKLLAAIRNILEIDGDIRVTTRSGSVKMELKLTPEQSERLQLAVERGELKKFNVVGATEAQRYKWIENEKLGRDLSEWAIRRWVREHWNGFLREKWLEHLEGRTFWIELEHDDFGLLRRSFPDSPLVDTIIHKLKSGKENLDILNWAIDENKDTNNVFEVLEFLDNNSNRIELYLENRLSKEQG